MGFLVRSRDFQDSGIFRILAWLMALEIFLETKQPAPRFPSSGRWPPSPDSNQEKALGMKIVLLIFRVSLSVSRKWRGPGWGRGGVQDIRHIQKQKSRRDDMIIEKDTTEHQKTLEGWHDTEPQNLGFVCPSPYRKQNEDFDGHSYHLPFTGKDRHELSVAWAGVWITRA